MPDSGWQWRLKHLMRVKCSTQRLAESKLPFNNDTSTEVLSFKDLCLFKSITLKTHTLSYCCHLVNVTNNLINTLKTPLEIMNLKIHDNILKYQFFKIPTLDFFFSHSKK